MQVEQVHYTFRAHQLPSARATFHRALIGNNVADVTAIRSCAVQRQNASRLYRTETTCRFCVILSNPTSGLPL